MSSPGRHLSASLSALLLLAIVQVTVETLALAWVYASQVLPPYGFFTTQVFDFLAKIRHFADAWLFWTPGLPDSFLGIRASAHLGIAAALLPQALVTAVLVGTLGGVAGFLTWHNRPTSMRGYLVAWAVFGLLVHAAATLPAFSLGEDASLEHVLYRSRSLVVDGTVVAVCVLAVSAALAYMAAPLLSRSKVAALLAIAVLALVATVLALSSDKESVAVVAEFTPAASVRSQAPYNVLLISLDSLRADHLGCYGYGRDTTPHVDELATHGIRFSNAIATSSWTLPTHLTMFTSRYQLSHGVVHDNVTLSPAVPTLGEIMKAGGFTTAGFVSGPYVAGHYGYARGMDTYIDLSEEYQHRREARSAIVAPAINENVIPWLEQHRNERFFLFVHYFDIHYDFVPPAPYDTMFDPDYTGTMDGRDFIERKDVHPKMDRRDLEHIIALYDGEIRFTDEHVGKVLAKIDGLGLADETVVVVVSDHGDEFFEHGNKGHHRTVYEEVLKVPFIVRLPGAKHAGTVVDAQVSLVDVMPTILDVVGLGGPPDMEGRSVLEFLPGAGGKPRPAVYAEFFDKRGLNVQVARRTADSKIIQHFNRITHPKRAALEYYDLAADPAELDDLQSERSQAMMSELAAMGDWLEQRWRVYREFERRADGTNRIEIDAVTMERLKSLGYVGE